MHATFTPDLPVYRHSDRDGALAAGRVATRTQLRARRMQPAPGQEPVGQYWAVHRWAQLYRVADCVPMPALSPGRQARWEWHRTCHRCGARRSDPWDKDWRFWTPGAGIWAGRPSCHPCKQVEDEVQAAARANRDRAAASLAARRLLADPTLTVLTEDVILPASGRYETTLRVSAVAAADGVVLLDDTIHRWHQHMNPDPTWETGRPVAEVADRLRALSGRTHITWCGPSWYSPPSFLETTARFALGEDLALSVAPAQPICITAAGATADNEGRAREHAGTAYGGCVDVLTRDWLAELKHPHAPHWPTYATPTFAEAAHKLLGMGHMIDSGRDARWVPAEFRARMLVDILTKIAADDHPVGPASCPQRFRRTTVPCAHPTVTSSGMCPGHTEKPGSEAPR